MTTTKRVIRNSTTITAKKRCHHRWPFSPSPPILQQQQQVGRKNNKNNNNKVVKTVIVVVDHCLFLHCVYDTINKSVANTAITAATFAIKDHIIVGSLSYIFIALTTTNNNNKSVKNCCHHRRPLSPPFCQ